MRFASKPLASADPCRRAHPPERPDVQPIGASRFSFVHLNPKRSSLPLPPARPRGRRLHASVQGALFMGFAALLLALATVLPVRTVAAQTPIFTSADLESELTSREAQLIAAVNVERQTAGLLPLRWNRNLSEAARWFARDAVITQPTCGPEDSLGRGPGTRMRAFGYANISQWGEALACGFTEPAAAVNAWMYGDPQRGVLMNPDAREAGAGYFYSQESRRGFVVFVAATDPAFAPVVINGEALSTAAPQVTLTVHPQPSPAVAMKVSNSPDFDAVAWEPYATEKQWTLEAGQGWHTVYVLLRSSENQTQLLSDTIYLGDSVARSEISLSQATNIGTAFSAASMPSLAAPLVRLSLDWSYDSSDPTFLVYQGSPLVEDDAAAVGGSVVRLVGGDRPGVVRGALATLPVNKSLTAYFRLKVSDNRGNAEVARLVVRANGQEFGPLVLKASDFAQPEQFQEFAVDFAFPSSALTSQTEVEVERNGAPDIVVDAVRFYGQPLSTRAPILWTTGSSAFRGQGVVARTQDAAGMGAPFYIVGAPVDAASALPELAPTLKPSPDTLVFKSMKGDITPANAAVVVCAAWCANVTWQATAQAPWLVVTPSYEGVIVRANPTGLAQGVYETTLTITPGPGVNAASSSVAVQLQVDGAEPVAPLDPRDVTTQVYLPTTMRP